MTDPDAVLDEAAGTTTWTEPAGNPGVNDACDIDEVARFRAFVMSRHGADREVVDDATGLTAGDLATVLYVLETPCQMEHVRRPPNPGRVDDPAWPGLFRRSRP